MTTEWAHGESQPPTKEYRTWVHLRWRCRSSEKYKHLTVCQEWDEDYTVFLEDMGRAPSPDHSIDRIDNDQGYGPDNCRWATRHQQVLNRRVTKWVTYEGKTMCVKDWARHLGLSQALLRWRLTSGWPLERALDSTTDTRWRKAS